MYLKQLLRIIWRYTHSKRYPLIKDPDNTFKIVSHIQDEQWVEMYIPPIFGSSKEKKVVGKYPSENFYLIPNATVGTSSDIIVTPNGVWWDKYYDDDFYTTALPFDSNVISFTPSEVNVARKIKKEYISGVTFSLVGVFSSAWSHFLFQFIPKLYFAHEAGLLDQNITILVDHTNDSNIEQMIDDVIKMHPSVRKKYADSRTDYTCEQLLCMRSASSNYNEMKYWLEYRQLTPYNVIDSINRFMVNPLVEKLRDSNSCYKKIYLPRKNNRYLSNNDEIENYFRSEGYYFVEGGRLTLEQKAEIFFNAEIIVGLHGAAWLNTIFCNNARCLMLGNSRNIQEPTFYTLAHDKVKRWINVTGLDEDEQRRSNYYIPLQKVKAALEELTSDN